MNARLSSLAALALVACATPPDPPPVDSAAPAPAESVPATDASDGPRARRAPVAVVVGAPPPPTERVFAAPLTDGAPSALFGSRAGAIWMATLDEAGAPKVKWVHEGRGVVQLLTAGDAGDGYAVWVAWGQSRDDSTAPVAVERIDPTTGAGTPVWQADGPRREAVSLAVVDVDDDGKRDLAASFFATEKGVRTRDRLANGTTRDGDPDHMATARAFVDLDGDGKPQEAIGHVYDEDPAKVGKLMARIGPRWWELPTEGGIKAIAPLHEAGRDALLVSDGWNSNYGKLAKARLSLVRFDGKALTKESVGTSSSDVSFFDLAVVGTGPSASILARGDATTTWFSRSGTTWTALPVPELARAKSVALVDRGPGKPPLAFDARRPAEPVALAP